MIKSTRPLSRLFRCFAWSPALLAFLVFRGPAMAATYVTDQSIAIPSYFSPPGGFWTQLENGAPTVGIAIINPASGPGSSFSQAYYNETRKAQAEGALVLGYVHTSYGQRSSSQVTAEINRFYSWYGVDGIFLDEASTDCTRQPYYKSLYNAVKAKGGKAMVIINPGTDTNECYMTATDIVVNFENTYSAYLNWAPHSWASKYTPNRFWHLVYNTPSSALKNALSLSRNRNAGWVYITPDNLPNPWDTLPADSYWANELYLVSQ